LIVYPLELTLPKALSFNNQAMHLARIYLWPLRLAINAHTIKTLKPLNYVPPSVPYLAIRNTIVVLEY